MGTTSMNVWDFAKAKIAALPMTALYVYLGAATGTLLMAEGKGNESGGGGEGGGDGEGGGVVGGGKESKKHMGELSLSPTMVVAGILLTVVIIVVISVKMKHELQRVLDQQTKRKEDIEPDDLVLLEKNNEQQQDVEMQEFISSSPNAIMSDGSGGTTGPLGQIQKRIVPKKKVVVGMETEQSTTATSSSTQQQS